MNSIYVKNWRNRTKQKLVESFGGKCGICSYNKSLKALEFHHLESNKKEFSLSSWSKIANWEKICEEAEKCVCLCANCHREVHDGTTIIPHNIQRFDKLKFNSKDQNNIEQDYCFCGKPKQTLRKTCSKKCSSIKKSKIDWSLIDLNNLYKKYNYLEIGKMLGVSDVTVRKHHKAS